MKRRYLLAMILLTAIISPSLQSVLAQPLVIDLDCTVCQEIPDMKTLEMYKEMLPIVIWADPPIYDHNSIVNLYGHTNRGDDSPVTIIVTNPKGNIVNVEQLTPDANGDIGVNFSTGGNLWKEDGSYILSAQVGTGGGINVFRIQVLVVPNAGSESIINYEIDRGKIVDVVPVPESTSLVVFLDEVESDSVVRLYLQRTVIDAKQLPSELIGMAGVGLPQLHEIHADDEFVVLIDGKVIRQIDENEAEFDFMERIPFGYYTEKKILQTRILTIPISEGSERIEITGTYVIPEFGPMVSIILIIAIAAIVVLTTKHRLLASKYY